jgi:hypothetical protein
MRVGEGAMGGDIFHVGLVGAEGSWEERVARGGREVWMGGHV